MGLGGAQVLLAATMVGRWPAVRAVGGWPPSGGERVTGRVHSIREPRDQPGEGGGNRQDLPALTPEAG